MREAIARCLVPGPAKCFLSMHHAAWPFQVEKMVNNQTNRILSPLPQSIIRDFLQVPPPAVDTTSIDRPSTDRNGGKEHVEIIQTFIMSRPSRHLLDHLHSSFLKLLCPRAAHPTAQNMSFFPQFHTCLLFHTNHLLPALDKFTPRPHMMRRSSSSLVS